MDKKYFFLSLSCLFLLSCGNSNVSSSSRETDTNGSSSSDLISPEPISESSSSSSKESSSSIEKSSSFSSSSLEYSSSSSSLKEESSSSSDPSIPEVSGSNPDGSPRIDVPSNYLDPYDYSSSYFNFDVSEYSSSGLPGGFSLIYGNSKYDKPSPSKYEYNEDKTEVNGLKMDYYDKNYNGRSYVGIQSPCLVSNKKIEFRFKVSASHGTQRKNAKKDKPLFTIYSFSREAKLINSDEYTSSSYCNTILNNGEVKLYITPAENISYFEFRLNQAPYKNSQEYNFNISNLTIRQWEYN